MSREDSLSPLTVLTHRHPSSGKEKYFRHVTPTTRLRCVPVDTHPDGFNETMTSPSSEETGRIHERNDSIRRFSVQCGENGPRITYANLMFRQEWFGENRFYLYFATYTC